MRKGSSTCRLLSRPPQSRGTGQAMAEAALQPPHASAASSARHDVNAPEAQASEQDSPPTAAGAFVGYAYADGPWYLVAYDDYEEEYDPRDDFSFNEFMLPRGS